jgi:hypothetical protein
MLVIPTRESLGQGLHNNPALHRIRRVPQGKASLYLTRRDLCEASLWAIPALWSL